MRSFKVNNYISLKLENKKTVIYINNKKFSHCKHLFFINPYNDRNQIASIDEAAENLDITLNDSINPVDLDITPEQEFWGHCSNLQTWVEHRYDTRLLHYSLSLPLLKELAKLGDQIARRIFKEEVAKKIESGSPTVIKYLFEENYLDFLDETELDSCKRRLKIKSLNLSSRKMTELPSFFKHFNIDIKTLNLTNNNLKIFPIIINNLTTLKELNLIMNRLTFIPNSIEKLSALEILNLDENKLTDLPFSIGNLISLKILSLRKNRLQALPESIGNLKILEILNISENKLDSIPDSVGTLSTLKYLYMTNNYISKIPKSIGNLKNLKILDLANNKLDNIPDSIGDLNSLEILAIQKNSLDSYPNSLTKINTFKSLKELSLDKQISVNNSKITERIKKKGIKLIEY